MSNSSKSYRYSRLPSMGYSLIELVISIAIAAILLTGLSGITGQALDTYDAVHSKNALTREARFAMDQMVRSVANSRKLLLPAAENTNTAWPESVRQFPPVYPGETAVLAFLLDPYQDLDGNNIADADNDGDGKIDEDPGGDSSNDGQDGIFGIDDDNDGLVDENHTQVAPDGKVGPLTEDDDEDDVANEDLIDGIDNDGDGLFDEDIKKQTDGNGLAGIGGVDDDGDGSIDEGDKNDDDEDGSLNEDWYDAVVFYLDNGALMQRIPVPWDEDPSVTVHVDIKTPLTEPLNGRDFIVEAIVENVSGFKVERRSEGGQVMVYLMLELTHPGNGLVTSFSTSVRVAGAL